jgi:Fe-S-cluster containining protein
MTDPRDSQNEPEGDQVPLRDDMNDALRHLHFMGMQARHDLIDVISRLNALFDQLSARNQIDFKDFEARREKIREYEETRMRERAYVQVDTTADKYTLTDLPQIDCASRLHLCKARCCKLTFALSFQDLDERVAQWEYSLPYRIRHKRNGYCVHHDESSGGCGIYPNRPGVCRKYDCRKDPRIWIDFEKSIPAPEESATDPSNPSEQIQNG